VLFSFTIWAAFLIISVTGAYFLSPEEYVLNFKPIPFLILVVVALLLIPIQTSVEELVFRGYLMQGFGNLSGNKWFPLLMTTLIFGGMHYWNPEVSRVGNLIMLEYLAVGLFLGVITLMDEGLELALGFHAANNIFGALLITADWTAFQTDSVLKSVSEPTYGLTDVLLLFITYPVLLYIFSKRYSWTNWKEKLTGKITANNTSNSI
jgi:membrane protease YdiL (CAAX protease family)